MILDDSLVAAGDKDEMFDASLARFVDHMLDQRPVDHRQHLLRHGLGGREEPGAQPGDWKDSFANDHGSITSDGVNRGTRARNPGQPGLFIAWQEDVYHPSASIVRLNIKCRTGLTKGCVILIRVRRASAFEKRDWIAARNHQ